MGDFNGLANAAFPFSSSGELAKWAAEVLSRRGIDDVAKWRNLEYWLQVELYRAVEASEAGNWKHLGEYEQPYYTDRPRSGSKTHTKWVDLVLAEPTLETPHRVAWIELKDVGRSADTIIANAKGLGHDLAALWSLDPRKTHADWLKPPAHMTDRGRFPEWNSYAPGLLRANHLIAQIVIFSRSVQTNVSAEAMEDMWLSTFFEKGADCDRAKGEIKVGRAETRSFSLHALVHDLIQAR